MSIISVQCVSASSRLLGVWVLEASHQEHSVEDERRRDRDGGVHEDVQLRAAETVLSQPVQHLRLFFEVTYGQHYRQ